MSGLALQLITENKNTRATCLDLGNCGLTQIPAEIGELVWLKSVSLASASYEWDEETWEVKESQNTGDENDGLIDIGPLAGLTRMRSLLISRTQVADLAPLAKLTALQTLAVSGTPIPDLAPLAKLTALQTLTVSRTQVADLSPLRSLISQGCPVRWSSSSWKRPWHLRRRLPAYQSARRGRQSGQRCHPQLLPRAGIG